MFKKGYRWKIGNGVNVDVASDSWIPKEGSSKPIMVNPAIQNFTVAQLLNANGLWNEELVKASFMECDAEAILNILVNPSNREDAIMWDLNPKGIFYVKSAYRMGFQLQSVNEASISQIINNRKGFGNAFGKLMSRRKSKYVDGGSTTIFFLLPLI